MKKKIYFENITDIGDIFLDEIFLEFERIPVLFTCKDTKNRLFLCLCSEIRGIQKWTLVRTTASIIIAMLNDDITMYQAFEQSGNEVVLLSYKKEFGKIKRETKSFSEVNELNFPEKGEFLKDFETHEEYIKELKANYE